MKCAQCIAEGKTSRIMPHGGSSTLMGFSPYYDEEGAYHSHDPNAITGSYSCSNGHEWSESSYRACPSCDYAAEHKAKVTAYYAEIEAKKKS